jgi:hypothetical protein
MSYISKKDNYLNSIIFSSKNKPEENVIIPSECYDDNTNRFDRSKEFALTDLFWKNYYTHVLC